MKYIKTFENHNNKITEDLMVSEFDSIMNEGISISELINSGKEITKNVIAKIEQWVYRSVDKIINLAKSGSAKVVGLIKSLYSFVKKLESSNPVIFKVLCMTLLICTIIVATSITASAATGGQVSPEFNAILNNLLNIASGLAADLELQNYSDLDVIQALTGVKDQMAASGNMDVASAVDNLNLSEELKTTVEDLYMNADFLKTAGEKTGNTDIQMDVLHMAKKGARHMMDTYLNDMGDAF